MPSRDARHEGLRLDESDHCVWKDGERLALMPKAFEVLRVLMAGAGRLVAKADLLDAVWADTHVTEAVLTVAVGQLREALGDDSRKPRFIETVHRRGYRWVGPVPGVPEPAGLASSAVAATVPMEKEVRLLGREPELAALQRLLGDGHRHVAFVTGEAGIGKTALVDAFAQQARGGGWLVARGQCLDAYGEGEAYMPLLEALDALCRSSSGARVVDVLRRVAPTWLVQMPGLLPREEGEALARTLVASSRERMTREILRALDELSLSAPLLLVLEDLHWSDHPTLSVLAALAVRREAARVVVLATLRPVDAIAALHPVRPLLRELVGRRCAEELAMEGLGVGAIEEMLQQRFDDTRADPDGAPAASSSSPGSLAAHLHAQTGGNPLFVLHAIDDLLARGWLEAGDGAWRLRVEPSVLEASVAAGTRELIEQRVDALAAGGRSVLEAASLVGTTFAAPAVAAALGLPDAEVEAACSRIARDSGLLRTAGQLRWPDATDVALFSFSHALVRQVVGARLGPAVAAALHQRIGERLATAWGGASHEIAGQLAMHFERGGDASRSVPQRMAAARVAQSRNAPSEAVAHLRAAMAMLGGIPEGPARDEADLALHAALLPPLFASGGATSSEFTRVALRIGELSEGRPLAPASLQARWALMGYHSTRGCFAQARSICDLAIDDCDAVADRVDGISAIRAVALSQRGFCRLMLGELDGAQDDLAAAGRLPTLAAVAPVRPRVMADGNRALAMFLRDGSAVEAFALAKAAAAEAAAARHAPTTCWAAATQWRLAWLAGDAESAARAAVQLDAVAEEFAVERWRALAEVALGATAAAGGSRDGMRRLRLGRRRLREEGFRAFDSLHALVEAGLLLDEGHRAEALEVLDSAGSDSAVDEAWCAPALLVLRARCLVEDGDAEGVLVLLEQAAEMAMAQSSAWWSLKAATAMSPLLLALGRGDDARLRVRVALQAIRGAGDLPSVREAADMHP